MIMLNGMMFLANCSDKYHLQCNAGFKPPSSTSVANLPGYLLANRKIFQFFPTICETSRYKRKKETFASDGATRTDGD